MFYVGKTARLLCAVEINKNSPDDIYALEILCRF